MRAGLAWFLELFGPAPAHRLIPPETGFASPDFLARRLDCCVAARRLSTAPSLRSLVGVHARKHPHIHGGEDLVKQRL